MRHLIVARRQRGFVLALTLWIMAAVLIVVSYFGVQLEKSVQLAQLAQARSVSLIGMSDARAELLFRLSTTPVSVHGLGVDINAIKLDDRAYRADGGTTLRLQDNSGLVSLSRINPVRLSRLLGLLGVPVDQRDSLVDKLLDYIDADDLRRLNGAESSEYRAIGLSLPRNAPLLSPLEVKNVMGWQAQVSLWGQPSIESFTSLVPVSIINPNTAPWQVLVSMLNIDKERADLIIARREQLPITDESVLANLAGVDRRLLEMQVFGFPSAGIRVTQSIAGQPWATRYNVTLTPRNSSAPWRIDYAYKVAAPAEPLEKNGQSKIPDLPPRPLVFQSNTSPLNSSVGTN